MLQNQPNLDLNNINNNLNMNNYQNPNNITNNPLAISNFNFNNNNANLPNSNINSAPQLSKNINPDNPEDILMDESFWNILPNKKSENTQINSNVNNTNIQNPNVISNSNQSNMLKDSVMEFNFNNSAAPANQTVIPEFKFDLPKQSQQVPFDTSFNINKVNVNNANNSNFNFNNTGNYPSNINNSNFNFNNNLNKNNFNNFNVNAFDKNLIGNNFQPNNNVNFSGKPYEDLSKKPNNFDINFNNLLENDNFNKQEDEFDKNIIKKQIRGAIIVKFFINFIIKL